jgi:hypothetical protein
MQPYRYVAVTGAAKVATTPIIFTPAELGAPYMEVEKRGKVVRASGANPE